MRVTLSWHRPISSAALSFALTGIVAPRRLRLKQEGVPLLRCQHVGRLAIQQGDGEGVPLESLVLSMLPVFLCGS